MAGRRDRQSLGALCIQEGLATAGLENCGVVCGLYGAVCTVVRCGGYDSLFVKTSH